MLNETVFYSSFLYKFKRMIGMIAKRDNINIREAKGMMNKTVLD